MNIKNFSAMEHTVDQKTETGNFLNKQCKIIYLCCGINFWFEDVKFSAGFQKIYELVVSKIFEVLVVCFLISECGSFITQHNLTERQHNDWLTFCFSQTIAYFIYVCCVYNKLEWRELVFTLAVKLKTMYNDKVIEQMMIKTSDRYMIGLLLMAGSTVVSYGLGSGFQSLTSNATFTTVIHIWPDVEDRSLLAGAARVFYYVVWWILLVRTVAVYMLIMIISISLGHQFKIVCKYFENLNNIFEGNDSQEEKEKRYEDGFRVGIKIHSLTLWCVKSMQETSGIAYSAQVIMNVSVLVVQLVQMMDTERTPIAVMPIFLMATCCLIASGVLMWNAGDVTIEASQLPTAIFHSGWHNCQKGSSLRVRKMVTIAIAQAQQPVLIKGFGFVELSYDFYVKLVKSSYSVFSIMY